MGIDISKVVIDVYSDETVHQSFSNDPQGFKDFLKVLNKNT